MGFSNAEPIASLSLYASRAWFTDVQQSHMLDLLRMDVLEAGRALKDEATDPEFLAGLEGGKIRALGKHNEQDSEGYSDNPDPASTTPEDETFDGRRGSTEGKTGKWVRRPTTQYAGFWRHRDDINWESDEESA
ncbi:hypothetical protein B0H13DRAFT_1915183 [Mycena leptocephala]|nr:hypothetical protein B0H13DRAFT_1915183 [Mycena leptocephala]